MSERVEQLIRDLSDADEATRRFAIEDLGDIGDAHAVAPLVEALSDASPAIREAAAGSLAAIGGEETILGVLPALRSENTPARNAACEVLRNIGEPAVTHLSKLLGDDDKDVRKFAVDVLALIASPAAGEALTHALDDVNINVAAAAAEALGRIQCEPAVEALTASLQANSWVRCSVARSLGQIGGVKALRSLNTLLGDDDEMVLFTAVQALGDAGDLSAVQYLLYLLEHPNPMIVNTVIGTVQKILDRTAPAQWRTLCSQLPPEPVMKLAGHSDAGMRRSAVRLLGMMGDEKVLPPLVSALVAPENREDEELRELALQAIVSVAPKDISPMVAVLSDAATSVEGRCELVDALGRLGRRQAFDPVAALLADPEVILRRVASRALAGLDAERATPVLCRALTDDDGHVRANAARGLGAVMAREAMGRIVPCFEDPVPEVREAAAWAVGSIGGVESGEAVAAVKPLLSDPYPDVREAAARALVSIGSADAMDALADMLREGDEDQRVLAIKALTGTDPTERIDRLVRGGLCDPSPKVCAEAIQALAGRDDVAVTPELLAGLEHRDPKVRSATLRLLANRETGDWASQLREMFLEDSDEQVRHDCATALGRLNPPGAIDALVEFLAGEPRAPFVVLGAIEALARIGDPRAEDVLGELAGSDDPEICETAANALETMMEGAVAGV